MRPSETNDLYARLGVPMYASFEQIRKAYKDLVLKYHPDKNPGNEEEATREFIAINEAYRVLSDPEKRREYDQTIMGESKLRIIGPEEKIEISPDGVVVKMELIITGTRVMFFISKNNPEEDSSDNKSGLERLIESDLF